MRLIFPDHFYFGTSTSAYQIETAVEHDWEGVQSKDGYTFGRTTDHEKQYQKDIDIISSLAPYYRMSLMWSRLQRSPAGEFDLETKAEYHSLLKGLRSRDVTIMMVIYHWANPLWFVNLGGWSNRKNVTLWVDFAKKLVDEYGEYVSLWNTFNEPNLYATLSYGLGEFPPYKKSLGASLTVISNMSEAHALVFDYIKQKYPFSQVGISHNCASFHAQNLLGVIPAKITDWWYMSFLPNYFKKVDFLGLSYYARISYDPFPITNLNTPEKIRRYGKDHDDIWEYYPLGLEQCLKRYWNKYRKPIIITENGICTQDDAKRIQSIKDYMIITHRAIQEGIDVRGYYHWSAWDNFEWTLGPTYRFGLYECNLHTLERQKKLSADVYSKLAYSKEIIV